ncbi:MAG: hypothetical protein ACFCVG_17400 [Kineosporiaceae bacterium]
MTALRFFGTLTVSLTGEPGAVRALAELWAPFVTADGAGPAADLPRVRADDQATASAELNRTVVARCPHPAVHSGVVALGGGAVALPATSGAGKSTLVTALCRAGAGYLSDEALVLAPDGTALPYPKPVALSAESLAALGSAPPAGGAAGGEHLLPAAAVGRVVGDPRPVRHVVLARRDPGAGEVTLDAVSRRDGLAALLTLGFNHHRDPARFLRSAAAAVTGATVWRLRYADVRRAAAIMTDVLS